MKEVGGYTVEQIMYNMEGKVAVVSGAAKGIGKATALRMAKEMCRMVLVDIPGKDGCITPELQETYDTIKAMGNEVEYVMADVSKSADIDNVVNTAVEKFGRIDFSINVAGVGLITKLEDLTEEEWDWTININMKGIYLMNRAVSFVFKKQMSGKIVNMSSINGVTGGDMLFPYNSSKAGVISLTQSFARHLGPFGVNVNSVCPGYVWTPMWQETDRRRFKMFFPDEEYESGRIYGNAVKSTCLQRPTTPDHIANVVCFLCSDEASEMTGQHLNVDGGVEFH
jgi:NAD(P)-dependent dehydrogenase (short-subunit alcohol dehydrogenase family)